MVKKFVFGIFILLLVIQPILAEETEIVVKTIPFAEIQLSFIEDELVSERLTGISDEYGDAKFTFNSDASYFTMIVFVKQNYENIMNPKKFSDEPVGETLLVKMIPPEVEEIKTPNKTETQEKAEVNNLSNSTSEENKTNEPIPNPQDLEEPSEDSSMTGFSIFEDGTITKIGYVLLGVLVLGFITFMGFKIVGMKKNSPREIKIKKLSEMKQENDEKQKSFDERIENAEKRISEAKEELEQLKKEKESHKSQRDQEIEEAKKRLIEDEKRLMELRGEKKKD